MFSFLVAQQKQKVTLCDWGRSLAGTEPPWRTGHLSLLPRWKF